MKRNKLLILLIATLTVLCSCSYDQLNIENPNNLPLDNFWTSEEDIQKGLIATYAALQLDGLLGGASSTQHPVRSDTGRPNNWNANAQWIKQISF